MKRIILIVLTLCLILIALPVHADNPCEKLLDTLQNSGFVPAVMNSNGIVMASMSPYLWMQLDETSQCAIMACLGISYNSRKGVILINSTNSDRILGTFTSEGCKCY